jgi:hypothetical protein
VIGFVSHVESNSLPPPDPFFVIFVDIARRRRRRRRRGLFHGRRLRSRGLFYGRRVVIIRGGASWRWIDEDDGST